MAPSTPSTRRALAALILALMAVAACNSPGVPPLEQRTTNLNKTIMCPVCPGESIDQSQNALAVQMRAIVRDKVAEGWTDDAIRDFFVERYGPSVVLEPPREGFGLAAWLVPPASVAAAALAFFATLRLMRRRSEATGLDEVAEPTDEELEEYYARLEAALGPDPEATEATDEDDENGGADSGAGPAESNP